MTRVIQSLKVRRVKQNQLVGSQQGQSEFGSRAHLNHFDNSRFESRDFNSMCKDVGNLGEHSWIQLGKTFQKCSINPPLHQADREDDSEVDIHLAEEMQNDSEGDDHI